MPREGHETGGQVFLLASEPRGNHTQLPSFTGLLGSGSRRGLQVVVCGAGPQGHPSPGSPREGEPSLEPNLRPIA